MADICEYKAKVVGKKNACYATFGSFPFMDSKTIEKEYGTETDYTLFLHGYCKWTVDQYASDYDGPKDIVIPEDPDEAAKFGAEYHGTTVRSCSELFNVEIWCNSADIDAPDGVFSEHYISGESDDSITYKEMPREIEMDEYQLPGTIFEMYYGEDMSVEEIAEALDLDEEYVRSVLDAEEE